MSAALSSAPLRNKLSTPLPDFAPAAPALAGGSAGTDATGSFSQLLHDSAVAAAQPPAAPRAANESHAASADGKTATQREDARLNARRAVAAPAAAPRRTAEKMPAEARQAGKPAGGASRAEAADNARDSKAAKVADAATPAESPDDAGSDAPLPASLAALLNAGPAEPPNASGDAAAAAAETGLAGAVAASLGLAATPAGSGAAASAGGPDEADARATTGSSAPGALAADADAGRNAPATSTAARATALQFGVRERQAALAMADAGQQAAALDAKSDAADRNNADFAGTLALAAQSLPGATAGPAAEAPGAAAAQALLASSGKGVAELKRGHAAETPPAVVLAQPLHDAGFAPEMAARLAVLAADGVSEARLHLNPVEMGPVSVQIVVDGQQAQISFHAEQEQTRSVLERSLPDLAAALRDNGLTLSGGGVFQQPREQGGAARDAAAERRGRATRVSGMADVDSLDAPMAAGPGRPLASGMRGVLDLYA